MRATQAKAPPLRVPLDLRLTEEELSRREAVIAEIESTEIEIESILERLSNAAAVLTKDIGTNAVLDLIQNNIDEDEASEQKDGEDQSSSSDEDESSDDAPIGMTEQDENFLKELAELSNLGLLDTLDDTHVAFRTLIP